MKLSGSIVAIAVVAIAFRESSAHSFNVQVPPLSKVKSVAISTGMPSPNQPSRLVTNHSADASKIKTILRWLSSAKPVSIENPHRPMPSIGPTTLAIELNNGRQILIQPAMDWVTHNWGKRGIAQAGHFAKGFVDFQYADSSETVRLASKQMDNWFLTGAWKTDFHWNK